MTSINRRNCLKVLAGSVLGLPAALAISPTYGRRYLVRNGESLEWAIRSAKTGDQIELVGKSYDCSGRQLVIPAGVSVFRGAAYARSVIRCVGVTVGRDSKLSNVCIIYNSRRKEGH